MRSCALVLLPVLGLSACGPVNPRADQIAVLTGAPTRGEDLFAQNCVECHRKGGLMKAVRWYPKRAFLVVILDGVPGSKMPGFSTMTDQDIADIYAYVEGARS